MPDEEKNWRGKMREFISRKGFFFILLISLVLFCMACKKGEKVEIRTGDGVVVVVNPKDPVPPRGLKTTLSIKEDLSLGAKSES